MTPEFKAEERQAIAEAVARFLHKGGRITRLPGSLQSNEPVTWNNRNVEELIVMTRARNRAAAKTPKKRNTKDK